MTQAQINCFFAIAETGSFSKAAQRLYIAQPAVSKQISTLERELQISLFHRTTKSVTLTAEGSAVYQALKQCREIFDAAMEKARVISQTSERRVLRLGCPIFWSMDAVYQPLVQWASKHFPWLDLPLKAYSQMEILEHLRNRELDVAIHTEDASNQEGLITRQYSQSDSILLFSERHPLADDPHNTACLNDCTVIVPFDLADEKYRELYDGIRNYLGAPNLKTAQIAHLSELYAQLEDTSRVFLGSELFLWKNDPQLRYISMPIPRKLFVSYRENELRPDVVSFADRLVKDFNK